MLLSGRKNQLTIQTPNPNERLKQTPKTRKALTHLQRPRRDFMLSRLSEEAKEQKSPPQAIYAQPTHTLGASWAKARNRISYYCPRDNRGEIAYRMSNSSNLA